MLFSWRSLSGICTHGRRKAAAENLLHAVGVWKRSEAVPGMQRREQSGGIGWRSRGKEEETRGSCTPCVGRNREEQRVLLPRLSGRKAWGSRRGLRLGCRPEEAGRMSGVVGGRPLIAWGRRQQGEAWQAGSATVSADARRGVTRGEAVLWLGGASLSRWRLRGSGLLKAGCVGCRGSRAEAARDLEEAVDCG